MSSVYDELKEYGFDVFLAKHDVLHKQPWELKKAEDLSQHLCDYPETEQALYLSYYLDELPDLIEEPELLWRLIQFERSLCEDDENKDAWRVAFQDYIKCFPWVEDLMNITEDPDLQKWQRESIKKKAAKLRTSGLPTAITQIESVE